MSAERKWVGQALERTEDRTLMTRGGHFIDDLSLPGVAHAAYVRSPHARAKIRHIDVSRALDHPGVYAVDHRRRRCAAHPPAARPGAAAQLA